MHTCYSLIPKRIAIYYSYLSSPLDLDRIHSPIYYIIFCFARAGGEANCAKLIKD